MEWLIIISVLTSIYMAFNIAANDIGNSMGTAVGSGSLKMKRALLIGAVFVFVGALFLGGNVIKTISEGIIPAGSFTSTGAFVVTISAGIWITITLIKKIPISGSDAIVSAVFGLGIASVGLEHMNLPVLGFIVLSWMISPLIGLLIGFTMYFILKKVFIDKIRNIAFKDRLEKVFSYLQIISSSFSALNVGALDIAVATGVLFAIIGESNEWLNLLGAFGLVLGIIIAGNRVTETIGRRITDLVPTRGFSAQMSAAAVVFIFISYGMPISPTQTLVGSVIGVGLARGTSTIKYDAIKHIAYTWIITIPACIGLSASIYLLITGLF
ncbi:anion permease [Methanobacterium alcaliphilum]|nr:inorganic phosphate transporter [Methanobacterium alcaliphilum]MCK9151276.1 anion permease [Methanobacterium alcaliphilum]